MLSDRCSVCRSVTLVYCGQTVGWIKMKLGSLPWPRPHCVRCGPSFPSPKGDSPSIRPCLLLPNSWMDQDATWYGGSPRPRPHCVRWGTQLSLPKKGHSSPQFSAHVCCGQTAGWTKMPLGMEVDLGPGHNVLDGDPAPPKRGRPPLFGTCLLWPNGWMGQDATWYKGRPQPWPGPKIRKERYWQ